MTYDVEAVRSHFPALSTGVAHFDGPGGTQTPRSVGQAIADTLTGPLSNRGASSISERNADAAVHGFRRAMADLLGADPRGIVYGRSATQLAYDFSRHLSKEWRPGDEIVVTRLDHDSNVRPWLQAAERVGATVRWVGFNPNTGELTADAVQAQLSERTRLVAVTAASNLIGTMPPIAEIARVVHATGALLYVDGVHYAAHASVDLPALGADFFTCSPYKFLGPHCGVLAAAPALLERIMPDKLLPSTNAVPERFEFGTLPYELMAGTTAAVDFLAGMHELGTGNATPIEGAGDRRDRLVASHMALEEYERHLRSALEVGLAELPGVTLHSRAARRTPTLLVTFAGLSAGHAARFLAERDILAPAGSFYALEASRWLGLGDEGGLRIGLAPYVTPAEVDRLLAALHAFTRL
ncbi:cysteine desulfurase-like protein [Glaciibacter sp. 2TAF33]|uniref:cysteine desulfurase-like protein n=1 Tax=Glaciibacter sp. 2TAF33 TaxID=3233015 RepID=UPI003F926A2F